MEKTEEYENLTLEEEIERAEAHYKQCFKRYKSLRQTVSLYNRKNEVYSWNTRYYDCVVSSHETIERSMLNFLIKEIQLVRQDFEKLKADVKIDVLPYINLLISFDIDDAEENAVCTELFTSDSYCSESPSVEKVREKAIKESDALSKAIFSLSFSIKMTPLEASNNLKKMLERYKREKKNDIDFYVMEYLSGDIKEDKKKMDEEFKDKKAVKCWFKASGDFQKTIIEMEHQLCVQSDLLALLDYLAKRDRLTEREEGKKQTILVQTIKKTNSDKNELTDAKKKEIVKVSIQFVLDYQDVNGNNTFNEQQQWEGVYATLVRYNYCANIPNEFPSYLDSLELDFSKAKVKRPCKNFTRYGITKMLINDGVWSLDNKKTESSIRLVYELFNKKLAEELEKRKPKIEK